ncbi:MAG: hypothetical protein PHG85_03270 [Candidatus Altiarchaeota archaeon]|nr:hypothetical protein [Candidatus Altiarchaeota archaeon]
MKYAIVFFLLVFTSGCLCCPPLNPNEDASTTQATLKTTTTLKPATTLKQATTTLSSNGGSLSSAGSIAELLDADTSVTCTYQNPTGLKSSAVIYVSGDKFRMEHTFGPQVYYSVSDGKWVYSWSGGSSTGSKVRLDVLKSHHGDLPSDVGRDINAPVSFSCEPWKAVNSKFTLPRDVTFEDKTDEVEGASGGTTGGSMADPEEWKQLCASLCDGKPLDERALCRKTMGC